jgi:hypothetical protein
MRGQTIKTFVHRQAKDNVQAIIKEQSEPHRHTKISNRRSRALKRSTGQCPVPSN